MPHISWTFTRTPRILFGAGSSDKLGETLAAYGRRVLLVTGGSSLRSSGHWPSFEDQARRLKLRVETVSVRGEPSPEIVDAAVSRFAGIDVVCAIGGGSVIDAGKAISAMLPLGGSVVDYLESVGTRTHPGVKVPLVAVPTTAGTGSEATKNAVLSRIGPEGFKRSLRHENFVPDVAVVDPALTISCPPGVTAACGMDAFTQLLESYVSPAASPITDALAFTGIERVKTALVPVCTDRGKDLDMRASLSYAAIISGITLANAGLGVVHAFAASIGGLREIPHGVVCGRLLGPCTEANIRALQCESPGHPALGKYACIGALLSGNYAADCAASCRALVDTITDWTSRLSIPRLGSYGITAQDVDSIVGRTVVKSNCAVLPRHELVAAVATSI